MNAIRDIIDSGHISIGIEFGSTRIKTVLIDRQGNILAKGGFNWENQLLDGFWTYHKKDIWLGVQNAYSNLLTSVREEYGTVITKANAIGISGMMHGYMPFDKNKNLLVPFRTWRNNNTLSAAKQLTHLFNYNIPQRWSVAHLYQAILNQEEHVNKIDYLTTLAGYIHWRLSDNKVVGIGEASGMFPIDTMAQSYNNEMLDDFNNLIKNENYPWEIRHILPKILLAGQEAGKLTASGARLLDPTGHLQAGIKMCPPEGDAGTGMVATNSIRKGTGNISAGTSAFAMIVLEKELSRVYEELDMVTTPIGDLVAMAHANNCTSDINAWMALFSECLTAFGLKHNLDTVYETLFVKALEDSDPDCGDLLSYGFYSGEHSVGLSEGAPLFIHPVNSNFNLANFISVHLYTAFGAMKLGLDILMKHEQVRIRQILAHGGIFKTKNTASKILASAINVPISVMDTASEGGAWGMALLANYLEQSRLGYSLEQYLDLVFHNIDMVVAKPDPIMVQGYEKFMLSYKQGIPIVKEAIKLNTKIH
ncbi:ATPase [Chelonobacter oris]|nr:FGGY-family carbohydrate kinase [Chelonobacter oris]MDH2999783.1 ATPase [Chelonobacter oris]